MPTTPLASAGLWGAGHTDQHSQSLCSPCSIADHTRHLGILGGTCTACTCSTRIIWTPTNPSTEPTTAGPASS